ncbi:hypothetical protein AMTRI_Chr01g129300 [Amborella trichopoda]
MNFSPLPSFAAMHYLSSSPSSPLFPTFPLFPSNDDGIVYYFPPSEHASLSNPERAKNPFSLYPIDSFPQKFNFQRHCPPLTLDFSHGMVCFQASDSLDFFVDNPATGRCTIVPRHCEIFAAMAMGFYFEPISLNFKIFALGIFDGWYRPLLFCSVARKWRPIQMPEFIVPCTVKMDLLYPHCSEVQLWNGQVSVTHINGELKMKMWDLNEEKNWIQMIEVDLQSMRLKSSIENRSSTLEMMRPLLLFGDTIFISFLFEEEKKIIAFNVKTGSQRYPT